MTPSRTGQGLHPPPPPRQESKSCYVTGGTPLAVTQEHFLVYTCFFHTNHRSSSSRPAHNNLEVTDPLILDFCISRILVQVCRCFSCFTSSLSDSAHDLDQYTDLELYDERFDVTEHFVKRVFLGVEGEEFTHVFEETGHLLVHAL